MLCNTGYSQFTFTIHTVVTHEKMMEKIWIKISLLLEFITFFNSILQPKNITATWIHYFLLWNFKTDHSHPPFPSKNKINTWTKNLPDELLLLLIIHVNKTFYTDKHQPLFTLTLFGAVELTVIQDNQQFFWFNKTVHSWLYSCANKPFTSNLISFASM